MTPKAKYALASIAILTAFAAGRWLAPEHVKTVKEIVTVKEKQKVKIVEKDVHRTTTITEYPDGHKLAQLRQKYPGVPLKLPSPPLPVSVQLLEIMEGRCRCTLCSGFRSLNRS